MPISDVLAEGSDYLISLTKLTGLGIADIRGYVTTEFTDPVFKVTRIVFSNGSEVFVGGEHDIAYIEVYDNAPPALQPEELEKYYVSEDE